jgi:hypothetical protein
MQLQVSPDCGLWWWIHSDTLLNPHFRGPRFWSAASGAGIAAGRGDEEAEPRGRPIVSAALSAELETGDGDEYATGIGAEYSVTVVLA